MKLSKEETARREGMAYMMRLVREKGIDAAEEEFKRRNLSIAPMALPDRDLRQYSQQVREAMFDTVCILSCAALRDTFGFGRKRLEQFRADFWHKLEFIGNDEVTWQDWVTTLRQETGMDFDLRLNNDNVHVKRGN